MFALDDLYNNTPTAKPVLNTINNNQAATSSGGQFLSDFDLSFWATEANQWLLAFTVFYSFWFLMDFLFWKVIHHEGSVDNEKAGLESLSHIFKMWTAYLVYLGIWSVAILNQGLVKIVFEWISLVVGFIVLIGVDLPLIPVFGKFFSGADSAGNIFTQIWSIIFGLAAQLWAGTMEAIGFESPSAKVEKK